MRRIGFRNIDENAHGIGLREKEELLGGAAIASIDKRADIHIATRDDATKGGENALKGLQFLQATNICRGRLHDGALGGQVASGIVDFLARDAIGFDEFCVTRRSDLGEIFVSLRGDELCFGLR